jgi:Autographiviridae endonuclease VII
MPDKKAVARMREWRKKYPERAALHRSRWKAAHPEKVLSYKLLHTFGITLETFRDLEAAQLGRCAICGGTNSSGHALALDHDHKSGRIRGLLCRKCNLGVGYFGDDPERLRAAASYLGRSSEKLA